MMKYLKRLIQFFTNSSLEKDNLPTTVEPVERITRFVSDHDQITKKGKIRTGVFAPRPKDLTLSVYRTINLQEIKIWEIGKNFVDKLSRKRNPKPIFARCDLKADRFFDHKLQIKPVPTPHPRHADVINWSTSKDEQLAVRIELAKAAKLIINP